MTPRIGELFAGYGGLGMGVQAALGGEIAWVSEFDKGANKILAHRFPGVPNHGDIATIDWSQVEPVEILTGGSPCQDLSHAGKRAGMTEGTRSNLWVAMREAIAQLRPPLVVWENVRGAYSAAADSEVEPCTGCVGDGPGVHLRALGRVLGDLSELGYDCRWHGLRAADVGAPHGRFRVFVVAYPTSNAGRFQYGDGATASVAGSLRRGAGWPAVTGEADSGWASTDAAGRGDSPLTPELVTLPTPTARDWKNVGDPAKTAARMADRGQPLAEVLVNANWGPYARAVDLWETLFRPPPPPVLYDGKNGARRLNAAFSEWMMGLPAGWVTGIPGITRNEALKALGNGVVPQQAATALRLMLSSERAA